VKKVYIFILSLFPILLLRAVVFRLLFVTSFKTDPILIVNLLGTSLIIPYFITALFGFINLFLVWLIAKNIFDRKTAFITYLVYGISPWFAYMEYSASSNIIILSLLLLFIYGLVLSKQLKFRGCILSIASFVTLLYFSFLSWLIFPFLVWGLFKYVLTNFAQKKKVLAVIFLLLLPLLILSLKNRVGLISTIKNQVTVFSDIGLINTVNVFQGENRGFKPQLLARLTENRYSYLGIHFIYSGLTTINPINYFAPQYKMLGFSFSPALLLGLIIPFFFGISKLIKYLRSEIHLIPLLFLLLPAFTSRANPDFSRMLIVAPLFVLTVALGLKHLLSVKNKTNIFFFYSTVVLAITQFALIFIDILVREPWRLYQLTGV
jgi:hypothetical protein